ncbi:Hypothetical protein A7982_11838 [Minicystis rosea]|nr:Hypothetical protein A7982_11838 [Minicystis rosea]
MSAAALMGILLLACGGGVAIAPTGTGGESSTGSTGGAGTTSSSSSGTGGLPAPVCVAGEGAIVAAAGTDGLIAVDIEGAWLASSHPIPATTAVATYENVHHQLGAFWIAWDQGVATSHFVATSDGKSFDERTAQSFSPFWVEKVGGPLLLGTTDKGSELAYFDPDAIDWFSLGDPAPLMLSAAARGGTVGTLLGVGVDPENRLCDTGIFWEENGNWTDPHCRDDVKVFYGGEISTDRPHATTLPNGDVAIVFHKSFTEIALTMLHSGVWSTPESVTLPEQNLVLAITATPANEVVVAGPTGTGAVLAVRYVPGTGWGTPLVIDEQAQDLSSISAAPGICGDDALIAYYGGGDPMEVRVARLRGSTFEVSTVASLAPGQVPANVSISTRGASAP